MFLDEVRSQQDQEPSGEEWYKADTDNAIRLTSQIPGFGKLATDPVHADLFCMLAGIFSNGQSPKRRVGQRRGGLPDVRSDRQGAD
jgi:hypothetical protein